MLYTVDQYETIIANTFDPVEIEAVISMLVDDMEECINDGNITQYKHLLVMAEARLTVIRQEIIRLLNKYK